VPPSERLTVKSVGTLTVTGVVIEDELFESSPSLTFDTDASISIAEPPDVGVAIVTVIAGRDPPAGTGPGLVHNSVDRLQLQPLPDAVCTVAEDTEKFTLTRSLLA
jgi:hypothetical protein